MIHKPKLRIQETDDVKLVGGLRWRVRLKYWTDELKRMMEDPDLFLQRDAELFKREHMNAVGGGNGFVIKRYQDRTLAGLLKNLFRPSHAQQAWHKAWQLEQAGIASARPIACADRRRWGILIGSYFVMERIADAVDLKRYRGDKTVTARRLADLIAQLHNAGFSDRDLKLENIMLDSRGQMYLIDMEGVRHARLLDTKRAVKDLARLARQAFLTNYFTRMDALRFLRRYCAQRNLEDWRWWWKAIERNVVRLN